MRDLRADERRCAGDGGCWLPLPVPLAALVPLPLPAPLLLPLPVPLPASAPLPC